MKSISAAIVIGSLLVAPAVAQTPNFEHCKAIITDGLRNYSFQTHSYSYLNNLHKEYCSDSIDRTSDDWNAKLEIVVNQIPYALTGGQSRATEKLNNFCRTYTQQTLANSAILTQTEVIQIEGYKAYNRCLEATQAGLRIEAKQNGPADLAVTVLGDPASTFRLTAVTTQGGVTCSRLELPRTISSNVPFTCKRAPAPPSDRELLYQQGYVTVVTTRGAYPIEMPKVYRESFVAGLREELRRELAMEANKRIQELDQLIPKEITITSFSVVGILATGTPRLDCPRGWTAKNARHTYQPHPGNPIQNFQYNAFGTPPAGFSTSAQNNGGPEGALMVVQADCVRPPINLVR
jgi:hypothetical protein